MSKENLPNAQQQREEIAAALKSLENNKAYLQKACEATGELYFMRYEALQKAGFSKEEAFDIVKHRGID